MCLFSNSNSTFSLPQIYSPASNYHHLSFYLSAEFAVPRDPPSHLNWRWKYVRDCDYLYFSANFKLVPVRSFSSFPYAGPTSFDSQTAQPSTVWPLPQRSSVGPPDIPDNCGAIALPAYIHRLLIAAISKTRVILSETWTKASINKRTQGTRAPHAIAKRPLLRQCGCLLQILMGLKRSRYVMAVSACMRWDAIADVFYTIAVYDGRSDGPAPQHNGVVAWLDDWMPRGP